MRDFVIEDGVLKKYTGIGGAVTVPEGTTTIAGGFFLCRSMTSVTLPETVTVIEPAAFYLCENLETVTFPEHLAVIGKTAFLGCKNLRTVTIPGSVKIIGSKAFLNCGLQSVTISSGVEEIGKSAFLHCRQLREVTIPESVKKIGDGAFYDCALQTLTLPRSMKKIGEDAFGECPDFWCLVAPGLSVEKLMEQKIIVSAAMGYLCHPEAFTDPEIVGDYQKYVAARKQQMVSLLVKDDHAEGLRTYAALGKINIRNFERDFLNPALAAGATECIAFLMEWKNQNVSPAAAARQRSNEWKL